MSSLFKQIGCAPDMPTPTVAHSTGQKRAETIVRSEEEEERTLATGNMLVVANDAPSVVAFCDPEGCDPLATWPLKEEREMLVCTDTECATVFVKPNNPFIEKQRLRPSVYKFDSLTDSDDAIDLLAQVNEQRSWLDALESDGDTKPRFHVRYPNHVLQPLRNGDLHSVIIEHNLPVESLTQLDLVEMVNDGLKKHPQSAQPEAGCLKLMHDPEAFARQLASEMPSDFAKRRHHVILAGARILSAQNTTNIDFNVKLQLPDPDRPGAFRDRALPIGMTQAADVHRASGIQPTDPRAGVLYGSLPANSNGCVPLEMSCIYGMNARGVRDFNSPEAARWRMFDRKKFLDEMASKRVLDGTKIRFRIPDNSTVEGRRRELLPETLLDFVVITYTHDLVKAHRRRGIDLQRIPLQLKNTSPPVYIDTLELNEDAVCEVVDHYLARFGAQTFADNIYVHQLVLEPKQGRRGWVAMAKNGERERRQRCEKPVHISVAVELNFFTFNGPERLEENNQLVPALNQAWLDHTHAMDRLVDDHLMRKIPLTEINDRERAARTKQQQKHLLTAGQASLYASDRARAFEQAVTSRPVGMAPLPPSSSGLMDFRSRPKGMGPLLPSDR
jgi:hypothetical protein